MMFPTPHEFLPVAWLGFFVCVYVVGFFVFLVGWVLFVCLWGFLCLFVCLFYCFLTVIGYHF